MLKSIILAASLAVVGGLSLQPALAQGPQFKDNASFTRTEPSAKEPQGEHVRVTSPLNQTADASGAGTSTAGTSGNACVTTATSDCTQATVDDSSDGFRDKNDISRYRQITGAAR
jgi:hypothetical protein